MAVFPQGKSQPPSGSWLCSWQVTHGERNAEGATVLEVIMIRLWDVDVAIWLAVQWK